MKSIALFLLFLAGAVGLMAGDISGKWTGTVKGDVEAQGQIVGPEQFCAWTRI